MSGVVGAGALAGASITSSVASGLSLLTFDSEYIAERQARMRKPPKTLLHGLASGTIGLGKGLFEGYVVVECHVGDLFPRMYQDTEHTVAHTRSLPNRRFLCDGVVLVAALRALSLPPSRAAKRKAHWVLSRASSEASSGWR